VRSVLQTTPREEFPALYEELGEELFSFGKGELQNVFKKIVFANFKYLLINFIIRK